MILENLDVFKENLLRKLSLLLFVNNEKEKDLKECKKLILKCENLSKNKIIELIEIEEYNYGFKTNKK
tara:strand:- start:765 stop:968 length:204 start_codon:yes stop_codon:yes gene_type:complete